MHFYYSATSDRPLEPVCAAVQQALGLPEFRFDWHDNWEYAVSSQSGLRLHITEADDFETIEKWSPDCPPGANYQIILASEVESPEVLTALRRALVAKPTKYAESQD
jgi:hypothetical protein